MRSSSARRWQTWFVSCTFHRPALRSVASQRVSFDSSEGRVFTSLHQVFNRSAFSKFLNRPAGRIFRLAAGTGFLVVGFLYRHDTLGVLSMIWSFFPLTAGGFDVCYFSAMLGGPLSGAKIREAQTSGSQQTGPA